MSSDSIDLSGKIDPRTTAILTVVHDAAKSLGVDFFVVGATARDLILHHVYGLRIRRLTQDIDLGIHVGDWSSFVRLRQALLDTGQFTPSEQAQRLIHANEIPRIPLDIVPFGEIATEECEIRWPPDSAVVMSVLGFREAYLNSVLIRVRSSPPAKLAVVSPVGLTMLKLIAWSDAPFDLRNKHASDLALVVANYLDLGNAERVYEHEDLMEDFDYEITGARLLGRDLAGIISGRTLETILRILEAETSERGNLPGAMSRGSASLPSKRCLELLRALELGLNDRRGDR